MSRKHQCLPLYTGSGYKAYTSGQSSHSTQQGAPGYSQTRTQTNVTTDNQSGPGFWSGATLGGVLGYLFGRGNRGGGYYNQVGAHVLNMSRINIV